MDRNQASRVQRSGKTSTSVVVKIGTRTTVQFSGAKAGRKIQSLPKLHLKKS